jgi:hypothetical protein
MSERKLIDIEFHQYYLLNSRSGFGGAVSLGGCPHRSAREGGVPGGICFRFPLTWEVVLSVALAARASFRFYGLAGPMLRSDLLVRLILEGWFKGQLLGCRQRSAREGGVPGGICFRFPLTWEAVLIVAPAARASF